MTEALPCPFCGANEGLTMADGSTHRWGIAYCNGCGASAGEVRRSYPDDGKWYEEAIQQWNQRATPPQREWQGLTDEDLSVCDEDGVILARYWEAKLKEKNSG